MSDAGASSDPDHEDGTTTPRQRSSAWALAGDVASNKAERAAPDGSAHTPGDAPWEPTSSSESLRIIAAYATSARLTDLAGTSRLQPPGEVLALGRFEQFYSASREQLPQVVADAGRTATARFPRWDRTAEGLSLTVFVVPSGQLVIVLDLEVISDLVPAIPLLEDLYYADVTVADEPLDEWLKSGLGLGRGSSPLLLPERHQVVTYGMPDGRRMPTADEIQRAIYRADHPIREASSTIRYPVELNRRAESRAALGPYMSVLVGYQHSLEHAAVLSMIQVVAGIARLREIRERAYESVQALRAAGERVLRLGERRVVLEGVAETLGDLELDLSFSVEAAGDIGMLVPSLRVESYHDALHESMNLARRADTTNHMLARLRNALDAELTSVQSVEDRADDARRLRTAFAITFVSTTAGTFGLLFAFFGINATQVDPDRSMFDNSYLTIYLLVLAILLVAVALYLGLRWWERRATKKREKTASRTSGPPAA